MSGKEAGTGRLEAFSDGVIAVIITIQVPELKVPPQRHGRPGGGVACGLSPSAYLRASDRPFAALALVAMVAALWLVLPRTRRGPGVSGNHPP